MLFIFMSGKGYSHDMYIHVYEGLYAYIVHIYMYEGPSKQLLTKGAP